MDIVFSSVHNFQNRLVHSILSENQPSSESGASRAATLAALSFLIEKKMPSIVRLSSIKNCPDRSGSSSVRVVYTLLAHYWYKLPGIVSDDSDTRLWYTQASQ